MCWPYSGTELLIDSSKASFNPAENCAVKFVSQDLSLVVSSQNNPDPEFTESGKTSVCRFRLKEFGVNDTDTIKGLDTYTTKLAVS